MAEDRRKTASAPRRTAERVVYQGKIFTVKDIDLRFSDGKAATFQIVEKRNSVLIVPIGGNGTIIFIQEYFAAIDRFELTLPKGSIDPGTDAETVARRELQEEIGYRPNQLDALGTVTVSPGYLAQETEIFLARELIRDPLLGDEHVPIEVVEYNFDDVGELIESGELREARSIAALTLAERFLRK